MIRRPSKLRYARNIIVGIVILVVVSVGAGAGYIWFLGNQADDTELEFVETPSNSSTVRTPSQPASDAPVGVARRSFTTPVAPGENASLTAHTNAKAICTITLTYGEIGEKEKQSNDSGLVERIADQYGTVTWSWTVPEDAPLGKWPVEVTCRNDKNSGYIREYLEIKVN